MTNLACQMRKLTRQMRKLTRQTQKLTRQNRSLAYKYAAVKKNLRQMLEISRRAFNFITSFNNQKFYSYEQGTNEQKQFLSKN